MGYLQLFWLLWCASNKLNIENTVFISSAFAFENVQCSYPKPFTFWGKNKLYSILHLCKHRRSKTIFHITEGALVLMNPATHAICIMANWRPTHQPTPTTRVCLRYPVVMEFLFKCFRLQAKSNRKNEVEWMLTVWHRTHPPHWSCQVWGVTTALLTLNSEGKC